MFGCVPTARGLGLMDLYALASALSHATKDPEYPKYLKIKPKEISEDIEEVSLEGFNLWVVGIRIDLKLRPQDLSPELLARSNSDEILVKETLLRQVISVLQTTGLYA